MDLPKNLHKIIQDLTASLSLKDIELAGKDLQIEILTAENKRLLAEFFGRVSGGVKARVDGEAKRC